MFGLKTIGSLTVAPTSGIGDYDQIGKIVLSTTASSINFTNIPTDYRHLELLFSGRCNYSGNIEPMCLRINGDTSTNYDLQAHYTNTTSTPVASESIANSFIYINSYLVGNTGTANMVTTCRALFPDYKNTTSEKSIISESGSEWSTNASARVIYHTSGHWRSSSPITSISIFPATSQFTIGTMAAIYGIRGGS
jgi:hypothetical protein